MTSRRKRRQVFSKHRQGIPAESCPTSAQEQSQHRRAFQTEPGPASAQVEAGRFATLKQSTLRQGRIIQGRSNQTLWGNSGGEQRRGRRTARRTSKDRRFFPDFGAFGKRLAKSGKDRLTGEIANLLPCWHHLLKCKTAGRIEPVGPPPPLVRVPGGTLTGKGNEIKSGGNRKRHAKRRRSVAISTDNLFIFSAAATIGQAGGGAATLGEPRQDKARRASPRQRVKNKK